MEVYISPDNEARLREIAMRTGRTPMDLVQEAIGCMLDYDRRFLEAVEEGRSDARRGALLDHDEVVERISQILRS